MGAKVAFDQYKKNKVITATGVELIIQLYEEAMRNIRLAKPLLQRADKLSFDEIKMKTRTLNKAVNIITALADALDIKKGGEISTNLNKLYEFINMRLLNANLSNDPVMLDEALRVLDELHEAWVGLLTNGEEQKKHKSPSQSKKRTDEQSPAAVERPSREIGLYNHLAIKT